MTLLQVPVLSQYEWQKSVKTILSTPPQFPLKGDRYIIGVNSVGSWINKYDQIAEYNGIDWTFIIPFLGMMIYIIDEDDFFKYTTKWEMSTAPIKEQVTIENEGIIISPSQVGKIFTCNSTSSQLFNLPSGIEENIGIWFRFIKLGSGAVHIEADVEDQIADSGIGDTIYNDIIHEIYSTITIALVAPHRWVILGGHGTWITTTH